MEAKRGARAAARASHRHGHRRLGAHPLGHGGGKLATAALRAIGGTFVVLGRVCQGLRQLRCQVAAPQRADAAHGDKVFHAGGKHRVGLRQLLQARLADLGDARHSRQAHDADFGLGQRVAGVGHQARGDKAARERLVVHQANHPVAALARQRHAAAHVRHVAVNAQHLVAVAQALALGVHQQHDGATGMVFDRIEHTARLRQRQLHANGRVVGGTNHGHGLAAHYAGAAEQVARAHHGVGAAKQATH